MYETQCKILYDDNVQSNKSIRNNLDIIMILQKPLISSLSKYLALMLCLQGHKNTSATL